MGNISSRAENEQKGLVSESFFHLQKGKWKEERQRLCSASLFQLKSPSRWSQTELLASELRPTTWEHCYLHDGKFILQSAVAST